MVIGHYGLNGVRVTWVVVWETFIDGVGVQTQHHLQVVKIVKVMLLNLFHAIISLVQVRAKKT